MHKKKDPQFGSSSKLIFHNETFQWIFVNIIQLTITRENNVLHAGSWEE